MGNTLRPLFVLIPCYCGRKRLSDTQPSQDYSYSAFSLPFGWLHFYIVSFFSEISYPTKSSHEWGVDFGVLYPAPPMIRNILYIFVCLSLAIQIRNGLYICFYLLKKNSRQLIQLALFYFPPLPPCFLVWTYGRLFLLKNTLSFFFFFCHML